MKTFSKQLNDLAEFALNIAGTKHQYNKQDMFNASLVLQEVIMSLAFDLHREHVTEEQMGIIAEEIGKNLHQTIMLATGIDLHEVLK